ncbi:MAG: hypothetical protein Fur005_43920 [Roseiflexaceae bacterium]
MEFETQTLIAMFGLVGAVVVGGTLLAGPTERSGLPALGIFLLLGLLIGPYGLGMFTVALNDPILRVVATLSLTLVLFTDAMTLDLREVRQHKTLAALLLGPGTLAVAFGLAGVAWLLLGIPFIPALVLGAALASTDPVVLRGMLQGSTVSPRLRLALRLESGMNDVLLLPMVVIAIAIGEAGGAILGSELARLLVSLFLLGPLAGVAVGVSAVRLLVWVRDRVGVRREYEALYVIGVALGAFAAAESPGGSGFLAAFAAGIVVSALDVELCDCFLEYGQVTAEMALLFTFVLLGTGPIWSGLSVIGWVPLLFVAIVLLIRLPIFALALHPLHLAMAERLAIGWYAPRGLGTLLLALLAIFDHLDGGEQLVAYASLAVLVSIVLQGGWPLLRRAAGLRRPSPLPAPPSAPVQDAAIIPLIPEAPRHVPDITQPPAIHPPDRITIEQLRHYQEQGEPLILLDVRSERSFEASSQLARGALRATPERALLALRAAGVPADAWVVAFCT